MTLPSITHQFGPWSPMRFIPVPFREDPEPPAFWISTTRICRGLHDPLCSQADSQTFGPLLLEGKRTEDLTTCANCMRQQPPVDLAADGQHPICLFCSDAATVHHTGDSRDTVAAVSAVAALYAATTTLRHVKEADPTSVAALLEDTGDVLRGLLEDAAWAVKQDPARVRQTGYTGLVLVARQISANAREYAGLNTEQFPVRENDEGE